jgi:hypothetical protein
MRHSSKSAPHNNALQLTRSALARMARPSQLNAVFGGRVSLDGCAMRLSLSSVLVANLCLAGHPPIVGSEPYPTTVCDRTSQEVFGRLPMRIAPWGALTSEPKKIHHANPKLPRKWPKECRGMAAVHEALIAPSGSVERVYPIKSSCPAFDRLVSAAITQWKYSPTLVEGKAVPVCMTVTTRIHPQ